MPQAVIGCDLSRAFIGTCDLPSGEIDRIANTPNGIDAWLATLDHDVRIIFEATSGCDGELIAALAARGHPFSRVKPRQAGEFARATGTLAKTDRVDARVLAQMGAALDLPVTIPLSSARARLADFLRRRRQLVDMRKAEKLHRHSAGQPEIVQAIETMIDLLGRQIATLDRQIAAFIAEDHALIEQAEFLRRFPASAPPSLLPCSANSPSSAPCAAERSPRSPASPPPRPQQRHMAPSQTHLGRTTKGPRSPLYRRPQRLRTHPRPYRDARHNARQGQVTQDHPHRGRATAPRYPQRHDP